ncbi:MAG: hypothetical protein U9Q96_02330 [Patescibacteria group bacterium]|nr:hypothetical protein [Patescibacteria group bacterium]
MTDEKKGVLTIPEIPPTEVRVAEDGSIVGFQDYMDWNCTIVPGMNIRHNPGAEGDDPVWRVFEMDPEHGGGLDGRGDTLEVALQTSGLHLNLHARYLRLFDLKNPKRWQLAKILGGRAANFKIIHK